MSTPTQNVAALPFRYAGIIIELSEALKYVLQAQDWKERAPSDVDEHDRQIAERGNLEVAMTHTRNAFAAIDARHGVVHLTLRLAEGRIMAERAPAIARAIVDADPLAIPPALRVE